MQVRSIGRAPCSARTGEASTLLSAQLGSFADAGDMYVAPRKQGDAVRGQSAAP